MARAVRDPSSPLPDDGQHPLSDTHTLTWCPNGLNSLSILLHLARLLKHQYQISFIKTYYVHLWVLSSYVSCFELLLSPELYCIAAPHARRTHQIDFSDSTTAL